MVNEIRAILRRFDPFGPMWQHRYLIRQLTRREIDARYHGSILSYLWPLIYPLVILMVYTVVFGGIFKARWSEHGDAGLVDYAVQLYAGLIVFNFFSECLSRAPTLIPAVPNYVKKVVFPLEVLAVSILLAALFHGLLGTLILMLVQAAVNHTWAWTSLLLPAVWLPLLGWTLALTWVLSALGVYVRDAIHVVTLGLQVLFFTTPIIYPLNKVPERFAHLLRYNPLTAIVANQRAVLLDGRQPDWNAWLAATGVSLVAMLLGYAFFVRTRKGFADVL